MNHFTSRQVVVLCAVSMSVGAVLSPPGNSIAQPSEPGVSSEAGAYQTPQPLATPPTSSDISSSSRATTRAIGTITGEGAAGIIAKFTGPNSIGNSSLFESGGKVSIGTLATIGQFTANNTTGIGLYGLHGSTSGDQPGVLGDTLSTSTNAVGVSGAIKATSPGVTSAGVRGINNGTNANGFGVYGSHAAAGVGVYGRSGTGTGVLGDGNSGIGVHGRHILTTGAAPGVVGETNSTDTNAAGVQGVVSPTAAGSSSAGVRGVNKSTTSSGYGVYGSHAGYGTGVYGIAPSGYGVYGNAANGIAVRGVSTTGSGLYGSSSSSYGVYGSSSSSYGVYGSSSSNNGVYGSSSGGTGVRGTSSGVYGVYGSSSDSIGRGLSGVGYVGVEGTTNVTNGFAGSFTGLVNIKGDLYVTGKVTKGSGSFKIDHPQQPATKYLSHSFVESPDMMNVYNGNATTNSKGEVWVTLPSYFQALNRDFRYQLTPMGQFAQVIVGQKIKGNRFLIRTDKPSVEVSWQVTGIRNDVYARQHRIRVEETKTGADRGKYLYPAGFGAGQEKQIGAISPRLAKR